MAYPGRAEAFYRAVLGWCPRIVVDAVWPGARLTYEVADVGAAVAAVRAAGCQATARGEARDPLGLEFAVAVASAQATSASSTGTPGAAPAACAASGARRVSGLLYVPDAAMTRAFYAAVLGGPPHVDIVVGRGRPGAIATYAVDELSTAIGAVRAAGGSANEAGACTDDQGLRFSVHEAS